MADNDTITLRRPDDWHLHLRDGDMLAVVAPYTARQFARAIIMPNLVPPVTTIAEAVAYRERILAALPAGAGFTPLMTCYLTDNADADEIARGHEEGVFAAVKLYPAGATTNSDSGVTDLKGVYPVLERMQSIGMPLLIHGEVTDGDVDVYDREAMFIDRVLTPLLDDMPELRVVFEHATTADAVAFVRSRGDNVAATITAHHLEINRTDMFRGGIRPHLYCLPIAKRERHRLALREAATSGEAAFFLGTDSAPHPVSAKETDCGCAGVFSAPTALEVYTQVFDEEDALNNLEAFASLNGPHFYGLAANTEMVTLERREQLVAETLIAGAESLKPYRAGEALPWRLQAG